MHRPFVTCKIRKRPQQPQVSKLQANQQAHLQFEPRPEALRWILQKSPFLPYGSSPKAQVQQLGEGNEVEIALEREVGQPCRNHPKGISLVFVHQIKKAPLMSCSSGRQLQKGSIGFLRDTKGIQEPKVASLRSRELALSKCLAPRTRSLALMVSPPRPMSMPISSWGTFSVQASARATWPRQILGWNSGPRKNNTICFAW